jgi:hypothetical protein
VLVFYHQLNKKEKNLFMKVLIVYTCDVTTVALVEISEEEYEFLKKGHNKTIDDPFNTPEEIDAIFAIDYGFQADDKKEYHPSLIKLQKEWRGRFLSNLTEFIKCDKDEVIPIINTEWR